MVWFRFCSMLSIYKAWMGEKQIPGCAAFAAAVAMTMRVEICCIPLSRYRETECPVITKAPEGYLGAVDEFTP
jgi:hypothetical protein